MISKHIDRKRILNAYGDALVGKTIDTGTFFGETQVFLNFTDGTYAYGEIPHYDGEINFQAKMTNRAAYDFGLITRSQYLRGRTQLD